MGSPRDINLSRRKQVAFTLVAWALGLLLVNGICGLIVRNRYIAVDPVSRKTAGVSWGYFEPGQKKIILFPGLKEYTVTINRLGLRSVGTVPDPAVEDLQDRYRILAVGDSFTFGLFVNDEDTFPYRLQQLLDKSGEKAAVLNAGVGSTTMTDFLHYLKVKGLGLKPQLVTFSFCENDLVEMQDVPFYERLLRENVFSLEKTFKLAKFMRVFRKFELAKRYQRSTNKIKEERVRKALLDESKDLEDILRVATYQSGLPLNEPRHPDLQKNWERYFQALDETVALLRREGVEILFVIYPHIATVFDRVPEDYQDILIEHLERNNIEYIDLRPAFKERKDQALALYNNLPRDFHLSGTGNQLVAEEIFDKIRDRF